ncbi:ferritin family protein [Geomonas sp. RF6]|uniref:ferritin-like domain-containing protein n=1 Tax=Geomonas sp. RF6 TaxID=2897342 RepID=UPI001E29ED63|nr:ferritin family protein [Geomonas sp. RF6]UFS70298.1 ferritin family protein [Geomonas sp. RF6]
MEILAFAKKMELDGKAHYEKLAARSGHIGLKAIFLGLAQDEQKHYEYIQKMEEGMSGAMLDTPMLEEAQNVFNVLSADQKVTDSMKEDTDGYLYAMKAEADSVRLYEDAASKVDSADHAQLLLKIANEEKKHYNIMENLYDFVLQPKYYLEWREFTNLREL